MFRRLKEFFFPEYTPMEKAVRRLGMAPSPLVVRVEWRLFASKDTLYCAWAFVIIAEMIGQQYRWPFREGHVWVCIYEEEIPTAVKVNDGERLNYTELNRITQEKARELRVSFPKQTFDVQLRDLTGSYASEEGFERSQENLAGCLSPA